MISAGHRSKLLARNILYLHNCLTVIGFIRSEVETRRIRINSSVLTKWPADLEFKSLILKVTSGYVAWPLDKSRNGSTQSHFNFIIVDIAHLTGWMKQQIASIDYQLRGCPFHIWWLITEKSARMHTSLDTDKNEDPQIFPLLLYGRTCCVLIIPRCRFPLFGLLTVNDHYNFGFWFSSSFLLMWEVLESRMAVFEIESFGYTRSADCSVWYTICNGINPLSQDEHLWPNVHVRYLTKWRKLRRISLPS